MIPRSVGCGFLYVSNDEHVYWAGSRHQLESELIIQGLYECGPRIIGHKFRGLDREPWRPFDAEIEITLQTGSVKNRVGYGGKSSRWELSCNEFDTDVPTNEAKPSGRAGRHNSEVTAI